MNAEQFVQWKEESPGCGQAHPDVSLAQVPRADGGEGVICQSHASGLHSFFSEVGGLYEWGDEPDESPEP